MSNSNLSNSFLKSLVVATFSIGVALGSGGVYGVNNALYPETTHCEKRAITLADYERLQLGMTRTEVRTILGLGTEIKKTAETAVVVWIDTNGAQIVVTFREDVLQEKTQTNL